MQNLLGGDLSTKTGKSYNSRFCCINRSQPPPFHGNNMKASHKKGLHGSNQNRELKFVLSIAHFLSKR